MTSLSLSEILSPLKSCDFAMSISLDVALQESVTEISTARGKNRNNSANKYKSDFDKSNNGKWK